MESQGRIFRLQIVQWNLLHSSTRILIYRKHHYNFSAYYIFEDMLTYYNDAEGLVNKLDNQ